MENFTKGSLVFFFMCCSVQTVVGQTYATPELQQREEQHLKEKGSRSGVSEQISIEKALQVASDEQKLPDLSNYFEVSGIDAVNVAKHHSKEEKSEFEAEATSEFELNNFYLNLKDLKFIKMNRETKTFTVYEVILSESGFSLGCKTCNIPAFKIAERSEERIVCTQPPQDEGSEFEFRFTFER